MTVRPLEIPADPAADPEVLRRLCAAAAGEGPLLLPHAPGAAPNDTPPSPPHEAENGHRAPAPGGGIAVGTSGSTGAAKRAVLSAAALAASADATHARLGGAGQWLLALPAHHIAGLQVVLRSLRAGHTPAVLPAGSFTPAAFVDGVAALHDTARHYTSLVPTQLARIVGDAEALSAAASLDAVLVGGGPCPEPLLRTARDAGVRAVTTYGMSETAGGCVYDGRPLDGVHLRLADGRIHLAGSMLANGYLGTAEADTFAGHGGLRWFRTDDLGHLDGDGLLVVDGRADEVIISGGMKVWPSEVERTLSPHVPASCTLVVVGIPDTEWGERVAVVLECPTPTASGQLTDLLDRAAELLPPHARPRMARAMTTLPRLGPGKPDRRRLASQLMGSGWDDETSTTPEEG